MSDDRRRDDFLGGRARLAMLTTLRRDGSPLSIPVWFDWNGSAVSMFCAAGSPKLKRIEDDPRVTVLIANDRDEDEYWVSFDGNAEIAAAGGFDLAERLAARYWDLDDPERSNTLAEWRSGGDAAFRLITVEPTKIRTYGA